MKLLCVGISRFSGSHRVYHDYMSEDDGRVDSDICARPVREKLRGTHERNYGDRYLKGLKTTTGKWAKSRSLRVATVSP